MGQKRTFPQTTNGAGFAMILNGVMTGTATLLSAPLQISNLDNVGLQIQWTGTPTGTITILASIDGISFYAFNFTPGLNQPAGSASGYLVNLNQVPFPYIQVQYINSSSTGVLNVLVSAKDLN